MNHNEQIPFPEQAKKPDLEPLRELLTLWQERTRDYSEEYLAATICTELERQYRLGASEEVPEIKEARNLLVKGRTGERALADVEIKSLLDAAGSYVKNFETRKVGDEERAREGFTILSDYDALQLLLRAVEKAPLNATTRSKLRKEKRMLARTTKTIERNVMAFYAAAPMANDYCMRWNVEESSVLSRVAELGGRDLEIVWAERNRRPELLPEATPECLDENLLASGFEGRLKGAQLERFDNHVAACRRCARLLDEMTKSFIRMPARLAKAPSEFLPKELLEIEGATVATALKEKIRRVVESVIDFIVPRSSLQVVLQGAPELVEGRGLHELQHRQVLFEDKAGQVVLFLRGDTLCLSTFADKPGVVRGLRTRVIGDRKTVSLQKQQVTPGEVFYAVGPIREFLGKTLIITFLFGSYSVRKEVRIKEAKE